jgi:hypothetical protein
MGGAADGVTCGVSQWNGPSTDVQDGTSSAVSGLNDTLRPNSRNDRRDKAAS